MLPASAHAELHGEKIQWHAPRPIGTPYREANHVGIYRQNSLVDDLDAGYERVLANDGRPYGEPSAIVLTPEGFSVRAFAFRDPDGSTLEMIGVGDPAAPERYPGALHHCNLNVRQLARSYRFYHDVIGLDPSTYLAPPAQPIANGSLGDTLRAADGSVQHGGEMHFAATLMGVRTDSRNPLDVLEWIAPGPYGEAYREAHHLGISRVAFEVDDLAAARRRLELTGHAGIGPIETWDMGESGVRRVVIFRDPDGILLELIEQREYVGERPPF